MSALLYLPGFLVILCQTLGLAQAVSYGFLIVLVQVILGWPFLSTYPWEYLSGAFDLSRVFLFKWTVNWRFLGEEAFLSPALAKTLLLCHVCTLLAFAHFKWCAKEGGLHRLVLNSLKNPWIPSRHHNATRKLDCLLLRSSLITFSQRRDHGFVHVEFNRHRFREIAALSILFVVCAADSFPSMVHTVPSSFEVSYNTVH